MQIIAASPGPPSPVHDRHEFREQEADETFHVKLVLSRMLAHEIVRYFVTQRGKPVNRRCVEWSSHMLHTTSPATHTGYMLRVQRNEESEVAEYRAAFVEGYRAALRVVIDANHPARDIKHARAKYVQQVREVRERGSVLRQDRRGVE